MASIKRLSPKKAVSLAATRKNFLSLKKRFQIMSYNSAFQFIECQVHLDVLGTFENLAEAS